MSNEQNLQKIMNVLTEWNPLKSAALYYDDLDNYETEACDIIFNISLEKELHKVKDLKRKVRSVVRLVINEAFSLNLDKEACNPYADKIYEIIKAEYRR